MNKTVSIIMGRGIEGCGVTKFTLEQRKWFLEHDYFVRVFAIADKSWTRKAAHDNDGIELVKFKKPEDVAAVIDACNESDYVIINSLPAIKSTEAVIDGFNLFLENVEVPLVLIQHDHSSLSIKRNACLDEAIKAANVIFAHSRGNDFAEYVKTLLGIGGLTGFLGEEETPILNFQPGMDFDSVRDTYWKDITEQDPRHHKWIGRTTSWKGYKEMFFYHDNFLRGAGFMTTFEGIERSPAWLDFRNLAEFKGDVNEINAIDHYDLDSAYGDVSYVFGPYNNDDMLERMSKVGFGYQLSILKDRFIERSIEYTHCEVVCTGTVPVFRKRYGEVCIHRKFGKPLIECANNGTIWLPDSTDPQGMAETLELMKKLAKDPELRDDFREQAFEFYRAHQDSSFTFAELTKQIENLIGE